jgi:hypothetical protein
MRIPEGQTPPEVAELIKDVIKDKVVCDIGCGGGSFMEAMSKYAKRVIGIEEELEWANFAASRGYEICCNNSYFYPLPQADVYYSWSKDSMGIYLKAKHEGTKGTFIFGHSVRPSTKAFLESLGAEIREIPDFKVYITTL